MSIASHCIKKIMNLSTKNKPWQFHLYSFRIKSRYFREKFNQLNWPTYNSNVVLVMKLKMNGCTRSVKHNSPLDLNNDAWIQFMAQNNQQIIDIIPNIARNSWIMTNLFNSDHVTFFLLDNSKNDFMRINSDKLVSVLLGRTIYSVVLYLHLASSVNLNKFVSTDYDNGKITPINSHFFLLFL